MGKLKRKVGWRSSANDANLVELGVRMTRMLNHRNRATGAATWFCSPAEVAAAAAKVVGTEVVELDEAGRIVRAITIDDLRKRLAQLSGVPEAGNRA